MYQHISEEIPRSSVGVFGFDLPPPARLLALPLQPPGRREQVSWDTNKFLLKANSHFINSRQTAQSAAGEEQKAGNQTRGKLVCLPQNSDRKAPPLVNNSKCSSVLSDLHNLCFAHTGFWCLSSSS